VITLSNDQSDKSNQNDSESDKIDDKMSDDKSMRRVRRLNKEQRHAAIV